MTQAPPDPPERPNPFGDDGAPFEDAGGEPEEEQLEPIDTSAPEKDQLSGAPTASEDPQVRHALAVAGRHAELLGDELGDRLVGIYLIGSAILGDAWPHSDVDTVTVVRGPVADTDVLRRVHDQLNKEFPGVRYDTTYLERSWLTNPPADHTPTPYSQDGALQLEGSGVAVHPITWVELAGAVTVAGTPVDELSVAVDLDRARNYSRANLTEYWAKAADQLAAAASTKPASAKLTNPTPVVWAVLGAPRLAAFIDRLQNTRGDEVPRLVSKTEAGEWVRRRLPRYAELAGRCLDERHGRGAEFTVADVIDAAELIREVIVVVNAHSNDLSGRSGDRGSQLYTGLPGIRSPRSGHRGPSRGGGMQGQNG